MHIDGVLKMPMSFEHIDPQAVGNKRKFLASEVSGRGAIIEKVKSICPHLTKDCPETSLILEKLKEMEHFGYQFEAADASFELMVKRLLGSHKSHFTLDFYKTIGEFPAPNGEMQSSATIRVTVDGQEEMSSLMGKGPVRPGSGFKKSLECLPRHKDYKTYRLQSACTGSGNGHCGKSTRFD